MSDTRDDTTAEFERMLQSTGYATIHDVAAISELTDFLSEPQGAFDRPEPTGTTESLPTRR